MKSHYSARSRDSYAGDFTSGTDEKSVWMGDCVYAGQEISGPSVGIHALSSLAYLMREWRKLPNDHEQVAKIFQRTLYGPREKTEGELRTWLNFHTGWMVLIVIHAIACSVRAFVHMI